MRRNRKKNIKPSEWNKRKSIKLLNHLPEECRGCKIRDVLKCATCVHNPSWKD
jgi:hypothetical protein